MGLLPGALLPMAEAPPTPTALRIRPWLIFVFGLLAVVAMARFVSLDLMGGAFVVLTVLIGWYAMREGMNVAWLFCLAVILFLNSMFDAFIMLSFTVKRHGEVIGLHQPWHLNLVHGLLLVGPIVELVGACLCWSVYKDHVTSLSSSDAFLLDTEEVTRGGYGAVANGAAGTDPGASAGAGHRLSTRFQAFQGPGRRLPG
mmetsp:Transcript_31530/g.71633  ORF Transcript_31530/g.71633 Transcript_31530/m.71633 type:complete len:200 (+) Transcript_31530:95-694(+)